MSVPTAIMALNPKDKETDSPARQAASLTGETLADEGEAIAGRRDALPILDHRSANEIIGYNENGLLS